MRAQAARNEELTDDQRATLRAEADELEPQAATLKARGRAIEDIEDNELTGARDESEVTDYLCDDAQGETWNVLNFRKNVLAAAGTDRASVMGAGLSTLKKASRDKTIKYARDTARGLDTLPEFAERDGLVSKLERRATAHEEVTTAISTIENRLETEHRAQIGAQINQLRVDMVKLYGRLLSSFPRDFVESLFS
jgi:hypothetical protein